MRRRPAALAAVAAGLAVAAVPAHAAWSATGGGTGVTRATSLAAPGAVTAGTATTSSIALSWLAAAPMPTGTVRYLVERAAFGATTGWTAACGTSAAAPTAGLSCTDRAVTAATDYQYRVTSLYGSWRRAGTPSGRVSTPAATSTDAVVLAFVACPSCGVA